MIVRLFKMHVGLIRYLIAELKKKRTRKELIAFLKDLFKRYIKVILQELKSIGLIFDKEYQKKKKEYDKMQKIKADLNRALKILQYIDEQMIKQGKNRQQIRQFWCDFTKTGAVRQDIFDELLKDINQIK